MATPSDVFNAATFDMFIKGRWDNVKKNNPFLGILEKKGHMVTGCSGDQMTWLFRAGTNVAQDTADYQDVSQYYVPTKNHVTAALGWGEKAMFEAVSKGEFAQNDGEEVMLRLRDHRLPDMIDDFLHRGSTSLAYAFLNTDGSASSAPKPIYGLPSFFGDSNSAGATDKDETADDSYAGIVTDLDGVTGVTNAVSDAWTPKLVNTTASTFGSGASAKNNVLEYLSYGIRRVTFDGSDQSQKPTCGFLHANLFDYLRTALAGKQTIMLTAPVSENDVWGIGSSVQMAKHDGLSFFWDANMPSDVGYILNFDQIWLHTLKVPGKISGDTVPGAKPKRTDIFDTEVNYNDGRRAVTISATWRGQLRCNPRFQCKLAAYA
jgi:hypothetical protein